MKDKLEKAKIADLIVIMRGQKVLMDFHLSKLYEVETRALKQQVRRNLERFPDDFMFILNAEEIDYLVSQNVIANKGLLGGAKPMVFTEQGVAMLSSVLRSEKAVVVNIAIMRTFVQLRKYLESNVSLRNKITRLERKYDQQFKTVFDAIKGLIDKKNTERRNIGYKRKDN